MVARLDGRAVLITGAGSGIGRSTSILAAAAGAVIAAIDVDPHGLDETIDAVRQAGGRIEGCAADVTDATALATAIGRLAADAGSFHGVFANQGILPPPVPAHELDRAAWDRVVDVNLTGAVFTLVNALGHVVDGASLLVSGSSMAIRPR